MALADKLWKGTRDESLEAALVDDLARRVRREPWEVFAAFDEVCEAIAKRGPDRLRRSDV